MTENTDTLSFLDKQGFNYSIFSFLETKEEDDDILVISSDDRIVKLVDGYRIRVGSGYGCGGTTQNASWVIEEVRKLPKGSFNFAQALPKEIEDQKQNRINNKKSWKQWYKKCQSIGYLLFDEFEQDDSDILEALDTGLEKYVDTFWHRQRYQHNNHY